MLDGAGEMVYDRKVRRIGVLCDDAGDCGAIGNFRRVCPGWILGGCEFFCCVTGGISPWAAVSRQVVSAFSVPRSDTHGIAYEKFRPNPAQNSRPVMYTERTKCN